MSTPAWSPRRLDVDALARAQADIEGELSWAQLPRVCSLLADGAEADGGAEAVRWSARGERRRLPDGSGQVWLHLQARGRPRLTCQRCLAPVEEDVEVQRAFRFVNDETQAEREDTDAEEDVLAMNRRFDLIELVEDEILLALPLVPRHLRCPQPLPNAAAELADSDDAATPAEAEESRPHPFAVLARLKSDGGPTGGDAGGGG